MLTTKEISVINYKSLLATLLLLSTLAAGFAQTPSPSPQSPTQTTPSPAPKVPATDDQDDVVKITTNLVQVDAVVTKDGKPVKDLKAEDFEISEDGRKQEITSFTYVSNIPETPTTTPTRPNRKDPNSPPVASTPLRKSDPRRVIALVVDDLGLSAESMGSVRKHLRKFVEQQLSPNDLVAIIRTGGTVGALQQFTNDRRLIDKALSQVKWNMCSRVGVTLLPPIVPSLGRMAPAPTTGNCGTTSGWSVVSTLRVLRFIVDAMAEIPGRKSMVVFSDSLPREEQDFTEGFSRLEGRDAPITVSADNRNFSFLLNRIAEKAIRSSVVIYGIDAGGLQYTGLTAADNIQASSPQQLNQIINSTLSSRSMLIQQRREGADLIARQTGGFLVRNSNDFQLDRILEDQSGYYLLGYRPTDETFNRKFHRIKARVKKSGMTLRTRYGFFGVSEEDVDRAKRTPTDKTTVALMSPFGAQDIPIDLRAFFTNDKAGSLIRSLVFISAKDLTFKDAPDGWHNADLQVRAIIFGNNGALVDQATFDRTIQLRADIYEKALREGLMLQFDIPVKRPGAYQVRVAARDIPTSHIGAVGQFVEVPDLGNHRLALSGIVMDGEPDSSASAGRESVNAAVRRFPLGSNVRFACGIYNAVADQSTHLPKVVLHVQLFREGKQALSSPIMPVDASNQSDLARLIATGVLRLNPDLEPGNYFLQLIATDLVATDKQQQAIQWIDFEITK
jgi:VWFA-related protein